MNPQRMFRYLKGSLFIINVVNASDSEANGTRGPRPSVSVRFSLVLGIPLPMCMHTGISRSLASFQNGSKYSSVRFLSASRLPFLNTPTAP